KCRICYGLKAARVGEVEYYRGKAFDVFDCAECRCRFTSHDDSVYEALHSNESSCYGLQAELALRAKHFFDQDDLVGLKQELCSSSKNAFIIESLQHIPKSARLLEMGCSRGYLTSYFILAGFDVLGADISASALSAAQVNFGPFFEEHNFHRIRDDAPYDAIY